MSPARDRAEQRVDQRVERDIGVAVPGKAVVVRRSCTPHEPQLLARRRGGGRRSRCRCGSHGAARFGARNPPAIGQLVAAPRLLRPARRRCPAARATCASSPASASPCQARCAARIAAKRNACGVCTRRSAVAIGRCRHQVAVAMAQAVDHRQHRNRAACVVERGEQAVDDRGGQRRAARHRGSARGRARRSSASSPCAPNSLPRRAAGHRADAGSPTSASRGDAVGAFGIDHDDRRDAGCAPALRPHGAPPACRASSANCLGSGCPARRPWPGGDDDRGGTRAGHGARIAACAAPVAALPVAGAIHYALPVF